MIKEYLKFKWNGLTSWMHHKFHSNDPYSAWAIICIPFMMLVMLITHIMGTSDMTTIHLIFIVTAVGSILGIGFTLLVGACHLIIRSIKIDYAKFKNGKV
jgi:tellurite resistance protein TehA-like permease